MITTAIINQKGGVGKTSTAHALSTGLAMRGYKVLAVDLDAQCNYSLLFGIMNHPTGTLELLSGETTVDNLIEHTEHGDIIPSTPSLVKADLVLKDVIGREYKLKEALEPVKDKYDFCIIDTPPSMGILSINALATADNVVIPSEAKLFSLQGLVQLYHNIEQVHKYINRDLKVNGILLTRYNGRATLTKQLSEQAQEVAEMFHTKTYSNPIRECIALSEAQTAQENIFKYKANSNAAHDCNAFIEEYLERLEKSNA